MSLEQSISDLTTQAGLLLDLPQEIADAAEAQILRVGNEYTSRIADYRKTVYVNQATGDDTNDGTAANPVKSLSQALDLTPPGGICWALLQSAYVVNEDVFVDDRVLYVSSESTTRHSFSFERYLDDSGNTTYRALRRLRLAYRSAVYFNKLTIMISGDEAPYTAYPAGFQSCPVAPQSHAYASAPIISFTNCDINIPASPFGSLIGHGGIPLILKMSSITWLDQPPEGLLFLDLTNIVGTDVNTVPWLISNLTTV